MPRTHFLIFWRFSSWKWTKLAPIYSKRYLQHDSMPFFSPALSFTTFLLRHAQKSKFQDEGDDVRNETKANVRHGQLRPAQESIGQYLLALFSPFWSLAFFTSCGLVGSDKINDTFQSYFVGETTSKINRRSTASSASLTLHNLRSSARTVWSSCKQNMKKPIISCQTQC